MRSKFLRLLTLALVLVGNFAFAQTKEITGVVFDESNLPLPGASVIVKGGTEGTTTDFDGNYSLTVSKGDIIEVSFMGYTSKDVTIGESSTYNVTLQPDAKALEEVIVVGYGTAKKESFTGSATQMKGAELAEVAVPTITDALQGKSAGLQINSASGDPGSGSTVRIRGIGSMNASSTPLYVVDGVIISSGNVSQLSDGKADLAPTDVLSSINPNDIASMTVLKDASATAIYGARAANGVILITTKKGSNGAAKISFDAKFGVSNLPHNRGYNLMNSSDYYKQYYDAYRASGMSVADANNAVIEALSHNNPYNVTQPLDGNGQVVDGARIVANTDWVDEVFRTGKTQEYNVSASGGTDKTNYFISLGYGNTEGIIKGTDFSRYSFRLNLNTDLTEKIKVGTNTSFSYTDQNRGAGGARGAAAARNALLYPNAVPVYEQDSEGNIQYDDKGNPKYNFNNPVSMDFNPLFTVDNDIYNTKNYRLLSGLYLDANLDFILDGLSFRTDNSVDYYTVRDFQFYNPFHGNTAGDIKGRGYSYGTWNTLLTTSNKFSYKKIFGDHTIDVLAGIEVSQNQENTNYAMATGYAVYGDVVMPDLANAAKPEGASTTENKWSMLSYLGRVNYDYKNKYYTSASIRRDGSSRFGENNRFGTFYSLGASWRMSQEDFLSDVSWIDNLKLRASYGTSGNDQVGLYDYFTNFSSWNYDGKPGNVLFKPGNEDLTWETSISSTLGVDFVLFQQRLSGSFEYYNRNTNDLLYKVPISMSSGFSSVMKNSASLRNSGIELALDYRIIDNDDFSWDMGINYTINNNEITSLPTEEQVNGTKVWREGGSIYDFYLRDYAGVDKQTGEAMWYMDEIDANGNPTGNKVTTTAYNKATRYVVGSSQPDGYGGFNNTLKYKGFTLTANVFFSNGGNILDNVEADLMNDGNNKGYQLMDKAANSWKNPGDVTDVPKFNTGGDNNSNAQSTRYLYDATYAKLKAVSLSYQIPSNFAKRMGMSSMSTYISGNNLLIWTKDKGFNGFDPEVGLSGLTNYITPNPRSFVMGVKLNF